MCQRTEALLKREIVVLGGGWGKGVNYLTFLRLFSHLKNENDIYITVLCNKNWKRKYLKSTCLASSAFWIEYDLNSQWIKEEIQG